MENILEAKDLVKSFGAGDDRRRVLDKVAFGVRAGEFVAVMGPSGSGKSSLLYALGGLDRPDAGSVRFEGVELAGLGDDALADLRRRRMGFVFQQPSLLGTLDILDNIVLSSSRDDRRGARRHADKARELMRRAGIEGLARRSIGQVSGGQLQRAGICRALMRDPALLFADEPTGALDSASAEGVMELFGEVGASGTAILLVTHDAKVAARASRVVFMRDGKVSRELDLGPRGGEALEERTRRVAAALEERTGL